jgi:hypothetical protein
VLYDEVGEYLLLSESEESLSDLEFDTDNELDDDALLNVVLYDGNDEDDSVTKDFGRICKTVRTKGKFHGHC